MFLRKPVDDLVFFLARFPVEPVEAKRYSSTVFINLSSKKHKTLNTLFLPLSTWCCVKLVEKLMSLPICKSVDQTVHQTCRHIVMFCVRTCRGPLFVVAVTFERTHTLYVVPGVELRHTRLRAASCSASSCVVMRRVVPCRAAPC